MIGGDQDDYFAQSLTQDFKGGDEEYNPNNFTTGIYSPNFQLDTFTFDNILEAPSTQTTSDGNILSEPPIRRLRFAENSPSIIGETFPCNSSYNSYNSNDLNSLNSLNGEMDHLGFRNYPHPNNVNNNGHERSLVLSRNQFSAYGSNSDEPSPISNSIPDNDSLFVTSDEDLNAPCHHHPNNYPSSQLQDMTQNRLVTPAIFTDPISTRIRTQAQSTPVPQNCSSVPSSRSGRGVIPSSAQSLRCNHKRQPNPHSSSQQPSGIHKPIRKTRKRLAPDEDPENHIIKSLRTVKRMTWGEIVTVLNNARIRRGEDPSFTEAAVYGRFKRNAPLIAHAEGDFDFDTDEYMYMRKRKDNGHAGDFGTTMHNTTTKSSGPRANAGGSMQFSSTDDRLLSKIHEEVSQDIWELVAEKFEAETGKDFDALTCAERFRNMSS